MLCLSRNNFCTNCRLTIIRYATELYYYPSYEKIVYVNTLQVIPHKFSMFSEMDSNFLRYYHTIILNIVLNWFEEALTSQELRIGFARRAQNTQVGGSSGL